MNGWCRVPLRLSVLVLFALVAGAGVASAQTVRVKDASATIYEHARTSSDVVLAVPQGTVLTVIERQGDWYWVLVPSDYYGTRRSGYISALSVERTPGSGLEPGIAGSGRQAEAPVPGKLPAPRFVAGIGYGWQLRSPDFGDHVTFQLYQAAGEFDALYSVPNSSALDLLVGAGLTDNVILEFALWRTTSNPVASAVAIVPHPFQSTTRTATGEGFAVGRDEIDGHVQIALRIPLTSHMDLSIFAGPSVFYLRQDLIRNFTYREAVPYNTVEIDNFSTTLKSKVAVGGNVGADLTFMVWRFLGVGIGGRYARATMNLPSAGTGSTEVTVGGGQVSGGLRFRF